MSLLCCSMWYFVCWYAIVCDESVLYVLQYARDTQHEKIQRGLALGIAMVTPPSSVQEYFV